MGQLCMFYFSKCSLLLHVFIILNGLELQKQSVFAKIISLAHWIIAKWNYYYDVASILHLYSIRFRSEPMPHTDVEYRTYRPLNRIR